ncbi:MAG: hypothetical protein AB7I25_08015 [Vicinamibacterales bacterium]
MRSLLRLALDTAFAPRALLLAPAVPAGVVALFVLTWGDGTGATAWPAWTFYDQARLVEILALLWALPWMAGRALPPRARADEIRLSALTGAAPSRLLLARGGAALLATTVTVLFPVPIAILAQRMSGGSLARVAADDAVLLGLACLASVAALWIERRVASPAAAWALGVAVLAALAGGLHGGLDSPAATALAALALAATGLLALLRVADREVALEGGEPA